MRMSSFPPSPPASPASKPKLYLVDLAVRVTTSVNVSCSCVGSVLGSVSVVDTQATSAGEVGAPSSLARD